MEKRERHAIRTLLMVWLALLVAALPIFSGGSVAVASNTDWTETVLNDVWNILDIKALDANTAWAVGTIKSGGVILKTTDGGATWIKQKTLTSSYPAQPLTSISVVDANTAWASGFSVLLKTTDGGANWNVVYSSTSLMEGVVDTYALDANNVWSIYIDTALTSHILKTSDGGANWVDLYSRPYSSGALVHISAVDNVTAWAVGGALLNEFFNPYSSGPGTILKTSDGGATWQEQTPAGALNFMNVLAFDASTAWVSGHGGIMHTTDGGATWNTAYSQANTEFWGLSASDGTIWAAAPTDVDTPTYHSCIIKTVDGGSTWQTLYTSTTRWFCSIDAVDATHAWVGSVYPLNLNIIYGRGDSVILRTVNGGGAGPDITAITPTSCSQFTFSIEAILSGSGFLPGATVCLAKGDIVLEAYNVNVVSGNELTCTVWTFCAEPGAYDVVVTNPDGGTATLAGGFTVTSVCGSGASTAMLALIGMLGLLSLGHGLSRRRRRH